MLVVDGKTMTASTIALLYLAEAHPEPRLLSADPAERYAAQATIDVLDAALLQSVDRLARAKEKVSDGIGLIERALGSDEWLARARYSVADISGFALARRVRELPDSDVLVGGNVLFVE